MCYYVVLYMGLRWYMREHATVNELATTRQVGTRVGIVRGLPRPHSERS